MNNLKKPAVLILNQMAGPLTWELAEDIGKAFGSVALLTGHPDTLAKGDRETVKLYPATPYRRGSYFRRICSWLCYLVQAFFWLLRWPADAPVLLFSNPPMLVWLGLLMKLLRGQRYAIMVHDIYPDLLVRLGVASENHTTIRIWRWLNRQAYQRADVVMTLGEYMAATLTRQFDPARTKAGRVEVIYPWADTEAIRPVPKEHNWFAKEHGQVDKLTVMYSGNMGMGHDIESMLGAAEKLRDEPGIHFMFIGAGPKWRLAQDVIGSKGLTNVTLLPWQAEEVIPYSLATADVALVSLEEEIAGLAVPSKAFFSLAAGTPLIVICGQDTELAEIIKRFDCGWMIRPGEVDQLRDILLNVRLGASGQELRKRQSRAAAEKIGSRANSLAFVNLISGALMTTPSANGEAARQSENYIA